MAEALRPGGWLVVEDFCQAFERGSEPADPGHAQYRNVHTALIDFLERSNGNYSDFATALPQLLARLALADVGAEGRLDFGNGGSPAVRVIEAALRQVGHQIIAAGLADRSALDEAVTFLRNPMSIVSLPMLISAWGRRE